MTLTATGTPFNGPLGIAFDAAGDLFVANNGGAPTATTALTVAGTTIVEFLHGNLPAVTATPVAVALTPNVVLMDKIGGFTIQAPWALAFDQVGNLFSSNANPPNTLVAFAPASLLASAQAVASMTISPMTMGGNTTLAAPNGICFDSAFDLVAVSSAAPFGLVVYDAPRFTTGNLAAPGTFIGPGVTADAAGGAMTMGSTLNQPAGCTFGPLVM